MTELSFKWSYDEPFHSTFLACTMIISILTNGLLLFIINTTKSSTLGSYRYLLAVFATCDVATSFSHATLQPLLHMTRGGVYFIPRHGPILIGSESYDRLFCLLFATTYYQMFLILAYHYVYRYKTVTSAITRSFTDSWTLSSWIKVGIAVNVFYISAVLLIYAIAFGSDDETRALASPTILKTYDIDLQDRRRWFIALALKRPDPLTENLVFHASSVIALILLFGIFSVTGSVIVYCISNINGMIGSTENTLTVKTRKMHGDLFRALLIQTGLPMLFSYLPCVMIFLTPVISDIDLGTFGNVLYLSTSIFPSIDAFFIIFFIKRYRVAVFRLFRFRLDSNSVSSS